MSIYANDQRPIAGNQYVPDSMESRGHLKPIPPIPGIRNGDGLLVQVGLWAYEWTFDYMDQTEYTWWSTLLGYSSTSLLPVWSKRFGVTGSGDSLMPAARLWDRKTTPQNFSAAVIDLPTWDSFENNIYWNVTVHFGFMTPLGS